MLHRPAEPEREVSQRQPVFDVPWTILAVLAVLAAIHAARQVIPESWDDALFFRLALVPGRLTYAVAPERVVDAVVALAAQGGAAVRQAQAERWILVNTGFAPWTTVTYALLHADWGHLGLNGVWLLAFGTPVARRFGAWRFFAFLGVAALAGALAQWASQSLDLAPVIGASAAVSGCMGAALRFMFQPRMPLTAIVEAAGEGRRRAFLMPSRSLREVMTDGRAVTFLIAWFATNLVFGLASVSFGVGDGPIAWQAHVGGFLAGLLLFRFLDPLRDPDPADLAPLAPLDPAGGL